MYVEPIWMIKLRQKFSLNNGVHLETATTNSSSMTLALYCKSHVYSRYIINQFDDEFDRVDRKQYSNEPY